MFCVFAGRLKTEAIKEDSEENYVIFCINCMLLDSDPANHVSANFVHVSTADSV